MFATAAAIRCTVAAAPVGAVPVAAVRSGAEPKPRAASAAPRPGARPPAPEAPRVRGG